jgi:hypothetical protein
MERSFEPVPVLAPGSAVTVGRDAEQEAEAGWPEMAAWLSRHRVTVGALALIAIQILWKASFLRNFYFRDDDFHFTELSLQGSLDWHYLSYVGAGHFHPGVLAIIWIMARVAPYNWTAASAITLVMILLSSLAAWRLLRELIGNRPAILIPLALYLVTPLTMPNDSWWQSGIESLPLQAAVFLALLSHVRYVRTGRFRHAITAAIWLVVGLVFFEKAVVIPLVLFAVTAGFLIEGRLAASAREALLRYWRGWLLYGGIAAVYLAVLLVVLSRSTVTPGAPTSLTNALVFSGDLVKDTLLPGLLGGPWSWLLPQYGAVAYAQPPSQLAWLSVLVCLGLIVASIATRPRAWRAWAILAGWLVLADIVPILIGRLSVSDLGGLISLDTRYVADIGAVAAICVALAFWPVTETTTRGRPSKRRKDSFSAPAWRMTGVGLTAVLVVGSVWSVHSYEKVTSLTNTFGRLYLSNARESLASLPQGTVIFDQYMPPYIMLEPYYQQDALQSVALKPLVGGPNAGSVRWTQHPSGTIDKLLVFGTDGTLRSALISGETSTVLPASEACWPFRHDRAVIEFARPTPVTSGIVRLSYLAGTAAQGETVSVRYGSYLRQFVPERGLHYVYVQAAGSASRITVTVPASTGLCLGPAAVGNLVPSAFPAAR